jgi:hypothetical protein
MRRILALLRVVALMMVMLAMIVATGVRSKAAKAMSLYWWTLSGSSGQGDCQAD